MASLKSTVAALQAVRLIAEAQEEAKKDFQKSGLQVVWGEAHPRRPDHPKAGNAKQGGVGIAVRRGIPLQGVEPATPQEKNGFGTREGGRTRRPAWGKGPTSYARSLCVGVPRSFEDRASMKHNEDVLREALQVGQGWATCLW